MSGYHKNEIYAVLNEKGIPYEAVEHEAVFTMEEMERAGINAHGCICKNLFLRDAKGKQHFLVTVPDERRVDLKWLSSALGTSKLSFASAERLDKELGEPPVRVSPIGILTAYRRSDILAPATRTTIPPRCFSPLPTFGRSSKTMATVSFFWIFPPPRRRRNSRPAPGIYRAGSGAFCAINPLAIFTSISLHY